MLYMFTSLKLTTSDELLLFNVFTIPALTAAPSGPDNVGDVVTPAEVKVLVGDSVLNVLQRVRVIPAFKSTVGIILYVAASSRLSGVVIFKEPRPDALKVTPGKGVGAFSTCEVPCSLYSTLE
ncbi:MAG: hypothetical protein NVS3B3_05740 [Aquirhabdus sp.]